jgi:hypothetical protein
MDRMAETSLHRGLKALYAPEGGAARREVRWGGYRIDVVTADELVEIQHGSLAAIRGKVARLLERHRVRVVKPIVVEKRLIKRQRAGAEAVHVRRSPKRGSIWELFHELIYFVRVFPHPRLTLEVPLVEVEEWRYPGHGRRRRWRAEDFQVEDQKLLSVRQTRSRRPACLRRSTPAIWPRRWPSTAGWLSGSPTVCCTRVRRSRWGSEATRGCMS